MRDVPVPVSLYMYGVSLMHLPAGDLLRRRVNQITTCETQLEAVETYFDAWATDSLDALGMEWQPFVAAQ